MSDHHDHDLGPDPIDQAYAKAEAEMTDEAARAARRERVLAAIAGEAAAADALPRRRPAPWRPGRWLAAACVAGLAVLIASQVWRPPPQLPPPVETPIQTPPPHAPTTASAPAASGQSPAARPIVTTPASRPPSAQAAPEPTRAAPANAPAAGASPQRGSEVVVTAERREQSIERVPVTVSPAPPPPPPPAPAPHAFPAAPTSPPPASSVGEMVVTRRAEAREERPADETAGAVKAAPGARQTNAAVMQAPSAPPMVDTQARRQGDPAARLRAAAAGGRTGELARLLDQGVPVDAPDAAGDTALMRSIRADQPAAAALLRRRGASLDKKNQAGESARDLAAEKEDPALDRAIGVEP